MRISFTSARRHRLAMEQQGFSDSPLPFRWGQLERPLSERLCPRATRTAYGEESREIIDTTPPPISRRRIPFWIILAVIVTAIFIASALVWHWYGTLPR